MKERLRLYSLPALLALLLVMPGSGKKEGDKYKNYVVVVSMDAFRWDYHDIYNTPNLDRLAREGVKAGRLIPSFPTLTFPNHYTLATGLYPDHHGLVNNNFPAPDLGLMYRMGDISAVTNPAFYGGEPIWVTAENQGVKSATFYWVGSEAPVKGRHASYWKSYDESVPYAARIDTVVKWLSYSTDKRPGLITLYFDEPDAVAHDYGPVSTRTGEVVERLDSLIGVLRDRLSKLTIADKINLIVLSDHGMSATSSERYVNIMDIVPDRMISSVFGGNPVYMINPAEGKKDSVLLLLNMSNGLKAYEKNKLPGRLHYGTNIRIQDIVIIADSSWSIGTRSPRSSYTGGAHGYDNANTDMHAIFYAAGPAFKKGYSFATLSNVDVYNLICRILKIKPAKNDGNPRNIRKILN